MRGKKSTVVTVQDERLWALMQSAGERYSGKGQRENLADYIRHARWERWTWSLIAKSLNLSEFTVKAINERDLSRRGLI